MRHQRKRHGMWKFRPAISTLESLPVSVKTTLAAPQTQKRAFRESPGPPAVFFHQRHQHLAVPTRGVFYVQNRMEKEILPLFLWNA
jgi:hypothetical protein